MSVFDLDYYLNKAEKEYLLKDKEEYCYPLRITQQITAKGRQFEQEISQYSEIRITGFSDRRIENIKMGIPSEVTFGSKFLIKKRPYLKEIKSAFDLGKAATKEIQIDVFLEKNLAESKKKYSEFESAVKIVEFMLQNKERIAGLYPRQIPHAQSTKLLMESTLPRRILAFHLGRQQFSFDELCQYFNLVQKPSYFHIYASEILYDGISLSNHHTIITEANVNRFDFSLIEKVFVIENEEVFHAAHEKFKGMLILGDGKKAASLGFLQKYLSEKQIYYWGDIDKDGYDIFAYIHRFFPQVVPIGMDMEIINQFFHLKKDIKRESPTNKLPVLNAEYYKVCMEGIRIEQEQLPFDKILSLVTDK